MLTKTHPYAYRHIAPARQAQLLQETIAQLQAYASAQGYQWTCDLPTAPSLEAALHGATQSLRKQLLKDAEHLQRRPRLRSANQFLRRLCVRLLAGAPGTQVVRMEVSAQEAAIRATRKAWLKARAEAEELRLKYVAEKGDFYRRNR